MAIGRIPEPGTGIPESILDAKGDLISASAADTPARLAVGTNDQRLVAASGETTGLKWVADTQNTVVDAKGDLIVGTGADTVARLAVGTNGHTLVADSSTTTGLKWAAASSGALVYITGSGDFSGQSSVSINDCFSATYLNYLVILSNIIMSGGGSDQRLYGRLRVSGSDNTNNNYLDGRYGQSSSASMFNSSATTTTEFKYISNMNDDQAANTSLRIYSPYASNRTSYHAESATSDANQNSGGRFTATTSFTGLTIYPQSGTISGNIRVYGIVNS